MNLLETTQEAWAQAYTAGQVAEKGQPAEWATFREMVTVCLMLFTGKPESGEDEDDFYEACDQVAYAIEDLLFDKVEAWDTTSKSKRLWVDEFVFLQSRLDDLWTSMTREQRNRPHMDHLWAVSDDIAGAIDNLLAEGY